MSMRIPHAPSLEGVRSKLLYLIAEMGETPVRGEGRRALPSMTLLQDTVLPQIPTAVLRVLINLAESETPLGFLTPAETGARGTHTTRYQSPEDAPSSGVPVVSALVQAVDRGTVSVAELNSFLTLFAITPEIVHRGLLQVNPDMDMERISLNDAVYRLVSGRLVAATLPRDSETSRLWLNTAAVLAALVLIAAAVIRFS